MKAEVDLMANGQSQGDVANKLNVNDLNSGILRPFIGEDGKNYILSYSGGDPKKKDSYQVNEINTNATLRRDEWKHLDEAVMAASQTRLNGIADLEEKGLVYNLGNGMGTTVLESHNIGDAFEAELSMDGLSRSKGDRVNYATVYLPIPIIHVDYEINARVLEVSRRMGNPLDTTSAELASRKVAEKLEAMLFTSTTYSFGGGTIYSYLNHPDRNTETLTTDWDASGKTAADIVADVMRMKQASINALHYGPWMLYIPTAYETVLDGDYNATKGDTIRERILKIANISGIKVIDTLTANNVLLVQMTTDVVRLVKGLAIQNVQWAAQGNFVTNYKVLTIQVPQIRSDQNGKSGIVHLA